MFVVSFNRTFRCVIPYFSEGKLLVRYQGQHYMFWEMPDVRDVWEWRNGHVREEVSQSRWKSFFHILWFLKIELLGHWSIRRKSACCWTPVSLCQCVHNLIFALRVVIVGNQMLLVVTSTTRWYTQVGESQDIQWVNIVATRIWCSCSQKGLT